jgi:hypothetical protein
MTTYRRQLSATFSVDNGRGPTSSTPRFRRRFAILCVSLLIAFIWSAQFIVSIPLSLLAHGIKRSWPIMDYPMYSEPHFEGDEIGRLAVVGIHDNGEEIDIHPEDIGGGYWYFQVFARAVTRADEAVIRDTVRAYEARYNIHLTALRVENRPLLWKSAQVNAAPVEVLRTYPLTATRNPTLL